ncbi:helix-turn-helix domain-containing protein [Flavobacterium rakeshii]|uniref:Helix-turn-helix domain-containing protein n=1 Tax=Flavobacterium rakeshii TaxID=1038845 RepID=A0A6N8HFU8_9FLAO|nr:helix-turn-helix transcriptional regulator [Flavobacterium rakeshii]MUV04607.1 helix-turn-helix domain-containing protein [Flavobacterium rakeshii]
MAKLTKEDIKLKNAIAQRIEALREDTGLSQSEFAKEHAIDRQAINRWEDREGERGISIYTIRRFCKMVGITLTQFFDSPLFK